ncbi:MAG: hypothetical protein WD627_02740 [Actinomycetota bacterium]
MSNSSLNLPPNKSFSWKTVHRCIAGALAVAILALVAYFAFFAAASNVGEPNAGANSSKVLKGVALTAGLVAGAAPTAPVLEPSPVALTITVPPARTPVVQPTVVPKPVPSVTRPAAAASIQPAGPEVGTNNGVGYFDMQCIKNRNADHSPHPFCLLHSREGFSGTVAMSCPVTGPGVSCRFTPSLVTVAPGPSGGNTHVSIDWAQAADGDQDFVIQASSGNLTRSAPMSYIKGDYPQPAPTQTLPNGEPDYSAVPHVLFSCDRPAGERIVVTKGETIAIACTVTSHLGFSERMDMACPATYFSCTPNPPQVTPPPNGSVQAVYSLHFPEVYGFNDIDVRLFPSRNNVHSEPSYIDYKFFVHG